MARIIPGVEVDVVKEVVPPAANPSGIVGLIGITDRGPSKGARVASWKQFVDTFGAATAYSMPEARQILENGAFEMVVVPAVDGAARAELVLENAPTTPLVTLRARASGSWANGALTAEVSNIRGATAAEKLFDLTLRLGDTTEVFRNAQVADPDKSGYLLSTLNRNSVFAVALPAGFEPATLPSDGDEVTFTAAGDRAALAGTGISLVWRHQSPGVVKVARQAGEDVFDLMVLSGQTQVERFNALTLAADNQPEDTFAVIAALAASDYVDAQLVVPADSEPPLKGTSAFGGGADPSLDAYQDALDELTKDPDVDLVVASVGGSDPTSYSQVYAAVSAHCDAMTAEAKNRIGLGGVAPGQTVAQIVDQSALFNSDRFVLVAPHGIVGAVAGRVAQLDYFHSPTFKALAGVTALSVDYLPTDLRSLLRANVMPVDLDRQLGFVIVHALTTSGEQVSVTRVQDFAVRGVKAIADLFIGKLNNELARLSLRQKLTEFFRQMEKDGAIVPATSGDDPAFKVDVFSSQADFAQGIVRVDIAIRPVRAIDYVSATILVQA